MAADPVRSAHRRRQRALQALLDGREPATRGCHLDERARARLAELRENGWTLRAIANAAGVASHATVFAAINGYGLAYFNRARLARFASNLDTRRS